MIAIELPWPPSVLLPNSRTHWSKRAHAAKQCRLTAYALTRQAGIRKGDFDIPGRVKVTLAFAPPDRRRRDLDGMLSSAKNFLDGISDAIGIDDSRFEIAIRREEPVKGGVVRAELEAAPEDRIAHEAKSYRNWRRIGHIESVVESVVKMNRDMGHDGTDTLPDQELDPVSALQGPVAGMD